MPRAPKFKVRKEEGRNFPWTVPVPKELKDMGIRRLYFETQREAAAHGIELQGIWQRRLREREVRASLPPGVSLEQVVADYNERRRESLRSVAFEHALEAFLESRAGHSKRTRDDIRMMGRAFGYWREDETTLGAFDGLQLAEITSAHIQKAVEPMTWNSRRKWRNLLGTMFTWCAKSQRAWCSANPAPDVEIGQRPERDDDGEVAILSTRQVRRLLQAATETTNPRGKDLVPFFVISLWAGGRTNEVRGVCWEDINWDENHVRLKATKQGRSKIRYVALPDCAMAWLRPYRELEGKITPQRNFIGKGLYVQCRRRAGFGLEDEDSPEWVENYCRHTFASNHLAHYSDITALMVAMNHETTKMLFAHYQRAQTEVRAAEFYDIWPADEEEEHGKVVDGAF